MWLGACSVRRACRAGVQFLCLCSLACVGCSDPIDDAIGQLSGGGELADRARMELNLAKSTALLPLVAAFADKDKSIPTRQAVAEALYRLHMREEDGRIVQALLRGLDDSEASIRRVSAHWLGNLRRADTTTPLIDRLEREDCDEVRLEILQAIEMANTVAEGSDSYYNTIITTEKFTDEEFKRFGDVVRELEAGAPDGALKISAREWLAYIVEQRIRAADRQLMTADVSGARAALAEAHEWMPDGVNINRVLADSISTPANRLRAWRCTTL